MRIDCAAALCDRAQFRYSWLPHRDYSAQDLSQILARNRFEGAILSAQTDDPAETDWLLALSVEQPWILGVIARGGTPADLDRWQRSPAFLGADGPSPELERRDLVCRLTPPDASDGSGRLVIRAMAGLSFTPAEFEPWARMLEPLVKTTALLQIDGLLNFASPTGWRAEAYRPWVQYLLRAFGPGRIAYGSGWPLSMPHATWKESLACFTQAMGAQTREDRARILGENAANYYRVRYTEESPG
jgi:L-fuconolactonase